MLDETARATLCHTLAGLDLERTASGAEQRFALRLRMDEAAGVLIEGGRDHGAAPIALSDERVVLMSRENLRDLYRSAGDLLARHAAIPARDASVITLPSIDPTAMPTAQEVLASLAAPPLMPPQGTQTHTVLPAQHRVRMMPRLEAALPLVVLVLTVATVIWALQVMHGARSEASAAAATPASAVSGPAKPVALATSATPVPATPPPQAQARADVSATSARVELAMAQPALDMPPADPVASPLPVATQASEVTTPVAPVTPASRLLIHARETSWITIKDHGGKLVGQRLLSAGQDWALPLRAGLRLTTGNAGGTEVAVGDGHAQPLGALGAVRRDVEVDALAR